MNTAELMEPLIRRTRERELRDWGPLPEKTVSIEAQAFFVPGLEGTVLNTENRRYAIRASLFRKSAITCLQHVGRADLFHDDAICDVQIVLNVSPNGDVTTRAANIGATQGEGHRTVDLLKCADWETLFNELSEDLADEARARAE